TALYVARSGRRCQCRYRAPHRPSVYRGPVGRAGRLLDVDRHLHLRMDGAFDVIFAGIAELHAGALAGLLHAGIAQLAAGHGDDDVVRDGIVVDEFHRPAGFDTRFLDGEFAVLLAHRDIAGAVGDLDGLG